MNEVAGKENMPMDLAEDAAAPLPERLIHKNWKIRNEAYGELGEKFQTADDDDACFTDFEGMLPKMVGDSNAAAQGQAVATYAQFVDRFPAAARTAADVAPILVSKCLGARPATQRAAQDALLLLIDIGAVDDTLAALEAGLTDRKVKIPPACLRVMVDALVKHGPALPLPRLSAVVREHINTANSAARALVKDLASGLYRYMGDALWAKLDGALRSAQETELKEMFEKEMAREDAPQPVPLRKGRGAAAAPPPSAAAGQAPPGGAAASGAAAGAAMGAAAAASDPWDFVDAKDLVAELDLPAFEAALADKKWKERVAALDRVLEICGPLPKLVAGADYGPIVGAVLKVAVKDVNVMASGKALQVLAALASGLRGGFEAHARAIVPELLPRFKEKKRAVADALTELLLVLHRHCLRLGDIGDVLRVGTRHKLPQVRVGTLEWLKACVERDAPLCASREALKIATAELEANLAEPDPVVRDAACRALGALFHRLGFDGPLRGSSERIKKDHAHQHAKIVELAGSSAGEGAAELLAAAQDAGTGAGSTAAAPAAQHAGAKPRAKAQGPGQQRHPLRQREPDNGGQDESAAGGAPASAPVGRDEPSSTAATAAGFDAAGAEAAKKGPAKPPVRPRARRPGPGGAAPGRKAAGTGASTPASTPTPVPSGGAGAGGTDGKALAAAVDAAKEQAGSSSFLGEDDAVAVAQAMLEGAAPPWTAIAEQLGHSKWSERVAGLEALAAAAAAATGSGAGLRRNAEAVCRLVLARTRGLKDTNVNVLKAGAAAAEAAIASVEDGAVSKKCVAQLVTPALLKAGDRKAKDAVHGLLLACCEAVGPQFVLATCYSAMLGPSGRAPPAQQGSLEFMERAVREFGARTVQVTALVEFCKTDKGLDSRSKGVRDAAAAVLAEAHRQLGPRVRRLVEDLKPALLAELDEAFARAGVAEGAAADEQQPTRQVKGAAAAEAAAAAEEAPAERVDLAPKLGPKLLKRLNASDGKEAWKVRLAALNEVAATMDEAGRRIQPSRAVRDVLVAMKERFGEKNAALKTRAIAVAGVVASSLGVKAAAFTKFIMKELIVCFADSKRMTRDAVTATFDAWVLHAPEGFGDDPPTLILDAVLPFVSAPLAEAAATREPLLAWLGKYVHDWLDGKYRTPPPAGPQHTPAALLRALVPALVKSLQDRNQAVREGAAVVLAAAMRACGADVASRALSSCKPAARRAMQPFLDRAAEMAEERGAPALGGVPDDADGAAGAPYGASAAQLAGAPAEAQETAASSASGCTSVLDAAAAASGAASVFSSTRSDGAVSSSAAPAAPAALEAPNAPRAAGGDPHQRQRAKHGAPPAHAAGRPQKGRASGEAAEEGDAPATSRVGGGAAQQQRRAASAAPARPSTARGRGRVAPGKPASGIPGPGAPRAGLRRGSVAVTTAAAAAGGAAGSASGPVLKVAPATAKAARARRAARDKWSPDLLDDAMASDLKELLSAVVRSGELLDMMFSRDARDHAMALVALGRAARDEVEGTIASLDLLLKWTTVRMTGRENVQTTAKLCEYLLQLFSMLEGRDHALQAFEAALFAPFLVEKLGHPKPRFRDSFKQVFGLFVPCAGATAAASALLEGLRSKNMKARVEVLDELRKLMDAEEGSGAFVAAEEDRDGDALATSAAASGGRFSWHVVGKKGLARIAAQVGAGDADVRHAALRTMEAAWAAHGFDEDALFAALPSALPAKIRDMLEERFKFSALRESAEGAGDSEAPAVAPQSDIPRAAAAAAAGAPPAAAAAAPAAARHPTTKRQTLRGRGARSATGGKGAEAPVATAAGGGGNIDVDEILGEIERLDVSAVIGEAMGTAGEGRGDRANADGASGVRMLESIEEDEEEEQARGRRRDSAASATSEGVFDFKRLSLTREVPQTPHPGAEAEAAPRAQAVPAPRSPVRAASAAALDAENEALWHLGAGVGMADDTHEKRNAARAVRSMHALGQLLLERGAAESGAAEGPPLPEVPAYQHGLDAVKVLHRMGLDAGEEDSRAATAREALGQHSSALLLGLLDCAYAAFDPELAGGGAGASASLVDTRALSCSLSAMMTLLGVPGLVPRLRIGTLRLLVRLCACGMLHAQLAQEAPKLVKALNLLAVRVLSVAPRVAALHLLLRLLRLSGPGGAAAAAAAAGGDADADADSRDTSLPSSLARRDTRALPSHLARECAKVVAKTLLRISRGEGLERAGAAPSPGGVGDVDTGDSGGLTSLSAAETRALLRESHALLAVHPAAAPADGDEDVVLAGVKTFLAALARAWGPAERAGGALSALCASALPSESPLHAIMGPLIERHGAAVATPSRGPAPTGGRSPAGSTPDDATGPPALAAAAAAPELPSAGAAAVPGSGGTSPDPAEELAAIFARIQSPARSEAGVEELHAFKKANPTAELAPHLAKLSPFFRQFVLGELDKLDKADSAPGAADGGRAASASVSSKDIAAATARMHAQMMATAALAAEGARDTCAAASAPTAACGGENAPTVGPAEPPQGEALTADSLRTRLADLKARYRMRTTEGATVPEESLVSATAAPAGPVSAVEEASAPPQSASSLDSIRARLVSMRSGSNRPAAPPSRIAGPSDLSQLREKIARMKEKREQQ